MNIETERDRVYENHGGARLNSPTLPTCLPPFCWRSTRRMFPSRDALTVMLPQSSVVLAPHRQSRPTSPWLFLTRSSSSVMKD